MGGNGEIVIYHHPDGDIELDVKLHEEDVWLNQAQMAELFQTERSVITKHIGAIYDEDELEKAGTCAKFAQVQTEGKRQVNREIDYYNLDVIISVGYRVNSSKVAIAFRKWATKILKEYLVKGFVISTTRAYDTGYFAELLAKIREIRTSERYLYDRIKDIFALTSTDYDPGSDDARHFFQKVQNRFHIAITGQTAAEIVYYRVDGSKRNLGLTNWKKEHIRLGDARTAKNYLCQSELRQLEHLVSMFLEYAELKIERKETMTMPGWLEKLDGFLALSDMPAEDRPSTITTEQMKQRVRDEYNQYQTRLPYGGDLPDQG